MGGVSNMGAPRIAWTAAVWTSAALLLAAQAWVAGAVRGEPIALSRTVAIWLAWAFAWSSLTPLAWRIAERFPLARPRLIRALAVHAVAAAAFAAVNLAVFALLAPLVGAVSTAPTWAATFSRLMGTAFLLNMPVYWLIIATAEGLRLARAAREREARSLRLEAQLADARLAALRAQLEPHFLFNALNTIAVLMREDVDAAERVLMRLAVLLRSALDGAAAPEVPLRDEIALLDAYLAVEQARFDDRLTYRMDVPTELHDARVPSLILQPLVENAVRHGITPRAAGGCVEIAARRDGGALELVVRDDGPGIGRPAREGVGLSNTRARLALLYGASHEFSIGGGDGGGTRAVVRIPLRIEPMP